MDEKLTQIFYQVYVGEAKAAQRLRAFAEKADLDGYPQISKLFLAIARSEEIHCERSMRMLGMVNSTEENLKASFESEKMVAEVAYDGFIKTALEVGNKAVAGMLSACRDVEDTHAQLYKKALDNMVDEKETTYFICKVCGFVSDGELLEECPVCNAGATHFEELK